MKMMIDNPPSKNKLKYKIIIIGSTKKCDRVRERDRERQSERQRER